MTELQHVELSRGGYQVSWLPAEHFELYWPQISDALDADPQLWNTMFTKEDIHERIQDGRMLSWVVFNGSVIVLVFLTERAVYPNGLATLHVVWMWGAGLHEILPLLDVALDQFAAKLECSRIEVRGRRGWERLLAPLGGEFQYAVFSRPVRNVRGN